MWTMRAIESANRSAGLHWFEPNTMRFFKSRIESEAIEGDGGIYFVTSEKGPHTARAFSVRQFDPATRRISTVGAFNKLERAEALELARACAQGAEHP